MKRKMIGAAAAYMAGLFFASFISGAWTIPLLAAIAAATVLTGRLRGLKNGDFVLIASFFAIAFGVSAFYTTLRYDKLTSYDGQTGSFEGRVTEIRSFSRDKASYVLSGKINGSESAKITIYCDDLGVDYGDRVTVGSCVFAVPEDDYLNSNRSYLRAEQIFLAVENAKDIAVEHTHSRRLKNALMDYRERVISEFRIILGEDTGDFLAGMVFGEKQGMDDNVKTALYRCGIGHVLAVSGLHVSIVVITLMSLLSLLHINKYVSFGIMNLFMMFLIVMANSPVSAIRAAIMMNFVYSARLFRRQSDPFNSLAAAVLLICIANPYVIYSSGFLLSVAGTFGIAVFAPYMIKNIPDGNFLWILLRSFLTMLFTTLTFMPLSMKFFEETSLIAPVVNVFVVPLCSLTMVIGVVYVITGGFISLLGLAGALIRFILSISDRLARVGGAYFSCGSDKIVTIAFVCAAAVILVQLIFRQRLGTLIALSVSCFIVSLSCAVHGAVFRSSFTVAVLGRGSNAAVVISYHGRTDIIDLSGHYKSPEYVRKYLSENGADNAAFLVLTNDVQSQYAAYEKELEYVNIENRMNFGENPVPGGESAIYFGESGYSYNCDDYEVSYDGGRLVIGFGGTNINFLPASMNEASDEELCVYYGNVPKNREIPEDETTIVLDKDGMNNFEIVFSENGRYHIRRL